MTLQDEPNIKAGLSRRNMLRAMVYSGIVCTGSLAYSQSDNLEILKIDVPMAQLPASLDGFTLGVMSDFHAGAWGNEKVISRAIQAMAQLKPDLITLLGDYVDGAVSHQQDNMGAAMFLFHELAALQAPFGVFAVLGNHDHWVDSARISKLLADLDITVLTDTSTVLANGLVLAGVDDYWQGRGNMRQTMAKLQDGPPVILLSHNPDINTGLLAGDPVALVLAGHTHGGQVRVPFSNWAPWVPCSPRYRGKTGLLPETAARWTFISKGVGSFFLPVRLACPPDIAVLTLKAV